MKKKRPYQDRRQLVELNVPHAPDASASPTITATMFPPNQDLSQKLPPDLSTASSSTQLVYSSSQPQSFSSSELPGSSPSPSPCIDTNAKMIQQVVASDGDTKLPSEMKQLFFKPKLNLSTKAVLNSIPSQPQLKSIPTYSSCSLSASHIHSNANRTYNLKESSIYDRRSSLRLITQSPDKIRHSNTNAGIKDTFKTSDNSKNNQLAKQFEADQTNQIQLFTPNHLDQAYIPQEIKGSINQNKLSQLKGKAESLQEGEVPSHKDERESTNSSGSKECLFQNQLIQQVMNNSSNSPNEKLPSFDINSRRESQQISSQLAYYQGSNRPLSNQSKRNKFILLCPQSNNSNCNFNLINASNSTKEDLLLVTGGSSTKSMNTSLNPKVLSNSFFFNKQNNSKQFEDTVFTHGNTQTPHNFQSNLLKQQQSSSSKLLCSLLDSSSAGSFWAAASGRNQNQAKTTDETWNKAQSQGYSRIKSIVQSQISNAESKFSNHLSALSGIVENIHKRNNASSNTLIPGNGISSIHEDTYINPSRSEKLLPQQQTLTPLEAPQVAPLKNLTQGICGKQIDIKSSASIALQRRSAGNFFKPTNPFAGLNQTSNEWNRKNSNNKQISAPSSVLSWEASSSLKTISHVYFPNQNSNNNNNYHSLDSSSPFYQLKSHTETKLNPESVCSSSNPAAKSPQKGMRNSFFKDQSDKIDPKINSKQLSDSFIQLSQPHPQRKIVFSYSGHDKV